ncbi:hypothetical protein KP509_05G019000 [Ceratopteris richardii]|uniref:Vacuolar iron transporter 1.1 n=1 Tax=Ceratopteris richardii TaxID=49495 RepID=A0A8T2UJT4_CERRI|nr:hypothetical protein KP509_05G019000 [Ceratopteris richardii]
MHAWQLLFTNLAALYHQLYYTDRRMECGHAPASLTIDEADAAKRDRPNKHFKSSEVVRDIIIGMSDGLTVPFALAAGLSGTSAGSFIVVAAGLAEVAAGSIAMGLGGYLAGKSDVDHYKSERKLEMEDIQFVPDIVAEEGAAILANLGLQPDEYNPVIRSLMKRPSDWLEFMMRFQLGLEKPDPRRALKSAATIAISYVIGGLVPLMPYILTSNVQSALYLSVGITVCALFIFGLCKGIFTGTNAIKSAFQTVVVGVLASAAAFALARAIQVLEHRHGH